MFFLVLNIYDRSQSWLELSVLIILVSETSNLCWFVWLVSGNKKLLASASPAYVFGRQWIFSTATAVFVLGFIPILSIYESVLRLILCLSIWYWCRMLICRSLKIDSRRFNFWWFCRSVWFCLGSGLLGVVRPARFRWGDELICGWLRSRLARLADDVVSRRLIKRW